MSFSIANVIFLSYNHVYYIKANVFVSFNSNIFNYRQTEVFLPPFHITSDTTTVIISLYAMLPSNKNDGTRSITLFKSSVLYYLLIIIYEQWTLCALSKVFFLNWAKLWLWMLASASIYYWPSIWGTLFSLNLIRLSF